MFDKPVPGTLAEIFEAESQLKNWESALAERKRKLAAAKQDMITSSVNHQLAIAMHNKLCQWNHTDGCTWFYAIHDGIHDWNEHSHEQYLRKATKVLKYLEAQPVTHENVVDFFHQL